jgi:hypothetical protein
MKKGYLKFTLEDRVEPPECQLGARKTNVRSTADRNDELIRLHLSGRVRERHRDSLSFQLLSRAQIKSFLKKQGGKKQD